MPKSCRVSFIVETRITQWGHSSASTASGAPPNNPPLCRFNARGAHFRSNANRSSVIYRWIPSSYNHPHHTSSSSFIPPPTHTLLDNNFITDGGNWRNLICMWIFLFSIRVPLDFRLPHPHPGRFPEKPPSSTNRIGCGKVPGCPANNGALLFIWEGKNSTSTNNPIKQLSCCRSGDEVFSFVSVDLLLWILFHLILHWYGGAIECFQ